MALAKIASAQTAGLGNLTNAGVNLGNQDLITTIAKVINIGLGVLGVVAVLLIIYAGFIWLTSQGNEEKIGQAKKILSGAVIGLVIILVSLAAATFIFNKLINATGGESGEPPLTVCADGSMPPCSGGFDRLQVTSTSPRHQEEGVKLCRRVQGQFNEKLDPGTVKASTIKIVDTKNTSITSDDEVISGTYNVADKSFSFRHVDFAAGRRYQATVFSGPAGVKDIRSRSLREDKKWYFTTGSETDSALPQVVSVYPAVSSTEACRGTPIQAVFSEEMDSTTLNKQTIILQDASGTVVPLSDVEVGSDFKSVAVYAASQLASRTAYTVTLKSGPGGITDACGNQLDGNKNGAADNTPADDYKWTFTTGETVDCKPVLDTLAPVSGYYGDQVTLTGKNLALTGEVLFNDWPADSHSFNNASNIVCWGTGTCPSNTVIVKVPVGMFPGDNKQVAVKVKIGRETSDGKNFSLLSPVVRALNPDRGPIGQFVTIFGWNFGTDKGTVKFGDKIAELACTDGSWTDREIVVKVPAGLNLGDYALQVITAPAKPSNLQNFIVNSSQLAPGLCSLLPQCSASGGGKITEIKGVRFGASRGSSTVSLDNNNLVPTGSWSDDVIADVPLPTTLNDGGHMVRVIVNRLASNAKTYDVPCAAASYPEVIEDSACEVSSQSPSPAKDNKEVCKNSLVSARFSEAMASASLSAAAIKLKKCNNADTFAATACVDSGVTNISYLTDQENGAVVGFAAEPTNRPEPNYWYQATITTGATSLAGVGLRAPYTWQWRVRSDASDCAINKVMCQPKTGFIRAITAPANTKNYSAAALAANCNLLNNQNLSWSWSSSDNTKATVLGGSPSQTALVTAVGWTSNNSPVNIKARLDSANKEASCDLYISGTACRESSQCRVCGAGLSACVNNNCTPVITDFSPSDGASGTWNSINGCYFGDDTGQVLYAKNGQTVPGLWPKAELCGKTWSNRQIVSELPPLATTGLFKVVRPAAVPGEAVSTQPFTVNNVNYPGLCKINPAYVYENDLGTQQAKVEISGRGFGDSQQAGDVVKYYRPDGFTLSQTASDYSDWTASRITHKAPLGTNTGLDKVAVSKAGVLSNKINFEIKPGSSSDTPTDTRPHVLSVAPAPNQTNVCRNTVIAVTFDRFLGSASPLTVDKFVVKSVCTGVGCQANLVTGSLKTAGTKLYFTPPALLAPLTKYEVELVGDKIICNNNCKWQFTTRDKACAISQVPVSPAQHTFTKPGAEGEATFVARALADDGQELAANFSWKNPASNIVTYQAGAQSAAVLVQATKNNGSTLLTVEADGTPMQAGKKTGQAEVEVFICDFPWEFSDPAEGFSLRYCRGNLTDPVDKRLPALTAPTPPYARNRGDLLGEYFFRVDPSGDVFGLRVYKNLNRLSPRDWYDSRTDIVKGNPQSAGRIDGYEAIKDGTSYYVGAVKQVGDRLYTNIYVLSFNQGAAGIAGQIADKLLSGWKFNTNVSDAGQLTALKRDIIRINDLALLKLSLNNYKAANGDYPVLTAGTFVAGLTTSVWPSWQATLGNALGVAVPTDPLNNFLDGAGNNMCSGSGYESFDAATCWNALSKQFKCPDSSHIYQYRYAGGRAYLYANFEYKNVVWQGLQASDTVTVGNSQSCNVATVAPTLILD